MTFIQNTWPIWAAFALYCFQAVILACRGDGWQAVIYAGYAFSNIGLAVIAARGV